MVRQQETFVLDRGFVCQRPQGIPRLKEQAAVGIADGGQLNEIAQTSSSVVSSVSPFAVQHGELIEDVRRSHVLDLLRVV